MNPVLEFVRFMPRVAVRCLTASFCILTGICECLLLAVEFEQGCTSVSLRVFAGSYVFEFVAAQGAIHWWRLSVFDDKEDAE